MSADADLLRASAWSKDTSQPAVDWQAAAYRDLPGLPTAFDTKVMAERLIPALLGASSSRYSTRLGHPGYVTYVPGDSCTLRYPLDVVGPSSSSTYLVTARVFADPSSSGEYFHRRLSPVARRVAGRADLEAFRRPATALEDIATTISVFPVDGDLPTLVDATDPAQMVDIFNRVLPARPSSGGEVAGCRVQRGHYGRRHRCVLRYEIDFRQSQTESFAPVVVFGKVTRDGRGAVGDAAISSLRANIARGSNPLLNLPRPLGFYPRLQLALTEAIAGEPKIGRLVKTRILGTGHASNDGPTLEESIDEAGKVAAGLHKWDLSLGPRRLLADETRSLRKLVEIIQYAAPELASRLIDAVAEVESRGEASRAVDVCLCHGDFSPTQLLFQGSECGLVDFDTICRSEPALDLGHFLAYLRLALFKPEISPRPDVLLAADLGDRFINAYALAANASQEVEWLRARSALYEVLSLVRLAVHSWQKLKMARLHRVLTLLDARTC